MRVTLIGAGPGDAGLITVKGARRLRCADVVLYDSLVSEDVLALIPDGAEKINVGKQAGLHPVPQGKINDLLLARAKEGKEVVRLKGGDPFVFSRGGEELELLAENGIPFEVIPGVSSAIAGPAYAGIPVTHRDCASSLHIVTAHRKENGKLDIDFEGLARLHGTVVFLMGVATVDGIRDGCLRAGMAADTPAAIVENATTPRQRSFIGTLEKLPEIAKENNIVPPAVIVVGEVCRYAQRFDWYVPSP